MRGGFSAWYRYSQETEGEDEKEDEDEDVDRSVIAFLEMGEVGQSKLKESQSYYVMINDIKILADCFRALKSHARKWKMENGKWKMENDEASIPRFYFTLQSGNLGESR